MTLSLNQLKYMRELEEEGRYYETIDDFYRDQEHKERRRKDEGKIFESRGREKVRDRAVS